MARSRFLLGPAIRKGRYYGRKRRDMRSTAANCHLHPATKGAGCQGWRPALLPRREPDGTLCTIRNMTTQPHGLHSRQSNYSAKVRAADRPRASCGGVLLRAPALERAVRAPIMRYTASGRSFARALWRWGRRRLTCRRPLLRIFDIFRDHLHKLLFCQRCLDFRDYLCGVINQVRSLPIGGKWQRTPEA